MLLVQASTPSNTYVVSGNVESKQLTELLPGILNQLGPESMEKLRKYAESIGATQGTQSQIPEEDDEDDDEVPDLVENFEEAAAK
jgi:nascent polypeptide-associated complex subunit beta